MEIDRRGLLTGAASLGLSSMVGPISWIRAEAEDPTSSNLRWHPLTQSLLDRAGHAPGKLDGLRVERIVHEVAGEHGRPVIKWLPDPKRAFEHLCRYQLDELARGCPRPSSGRSLRQFQRRAKTQKSARLSSTCTPLGYWGWKSTAERCWRRNCPTKARAIASQSRSESTLEARVVAAEIGWIETSLPGAAAGAIRAVEDLLAAGHAEGSMAICHQLMVFEAFEQGLLATWETPEEELVCVPVCSVA